MTADLRKIFVFGASGHAKVVLDSIEKQGEYLVAFLVDDDSTLKGSQVFGYPVIGGKTDVFGAAEREAVSLGFVAIGSNNARALVAGWLANKGIALATVVHPAAFISRGVELAAGTVVMAGAVINADSRIGENVIINTGASVDHDCELGDGAHIAPGASVCGGVKIGARSLIGVGAAIIQGVTIGNDVVVGAGATVVNDVPDGECVVGTPARIVKSFYTRNT
jgi:sugar O-acyltransferase (sialic acid O-acetyltransferase NeuD family)